MRGNSKLCPIFASSIQSNCSGNFTGTCLLSVYHKIISERTSHLPSKIKPKMLRFWQITGVDQFQNLIWLILQRCFTATKLEEDALLNFYVSLV